MESEHEVRSCDGRRRVIIPTLVVEEMENSRVRNRHRLGLRIYKFLLELLHDWQILFISFYNKKLDSTFQFLDCLTLYGVQFYPCLLCEFLFIFIISFLFSLKKLFSFLWYWVVKFWLASGIVCCLINSIVLEVYRLFVIKLFENIR